MKKIYLSIPINGDKEWQTKCQEYTKKLSEDMIFTPLDVYAKRVSEGSDLHEISLLLQDLHLIRTMQGIYFAKGYENSLGCKVELTFAQFIKRTNPNFEIIFESINDIL